MEKVKFVFERCFEVVRRRKEVVFCEEVRFIRFVC